MTERVLELRISESCVQLIDRESSRVVLLATGQPWMLGNLMRDVVVNLIQECQKP